MAFGPNRRARASREIRKASGIWPESHVWPQKIEENRTKSPCYAMFHFPLHLNQKPAKSDEESSMTLASAVFGFGADGFAAPLVGRAGQGCGARSPGAGLEGRRLRGQEVQPLGVDDIDERSIEIEVFMTRRRRKRRGRRIFMSRCPFSRPGNMKISMVS